MGQSLLKTCDGASAIVHDVEELKKMGGPAKKLEEMMKDPNFSIVKIWNQILETPGQLSKTFAIDAVTGQSVTFAEVEDDANRVAHWALKNGLTPGACVGLMMNNCAKYVITWLGFAKVGILTALINTSVKGNALVHALSEAKAVAIVAGPQYGSVVKEGAAAAGITQVVSFGAGGSNDQHPAFCDCVLDNALSFFPATRPSESNLKDVSASSTFVYIYTSGTTGLPKACRVTHNKFAKLGICAACFEITGEDIIYTSGLPLYHTAGNLAVASAFMYGCTIVLREKFSASNHFAECATYKATSMQYVGELCRYLLNSPEKASDKGHQIRVAFGNGLRPEIWDTFQRRFGIPEIGEFYSATEGNFFLSNHSKNFEGQGAIGRAGKLLAKTVMPVKLLQVDRLSGDEVRGPDGLCSEAACDEPGEAVCKIRKYKVAEGEAKDFDGYSNKQASEKKILRDVFEQGDEYVRTGDLLKQDSKGYFYFVDRLGDTFRWKGENVSTMEVSEVISTLPGVLEAIIYGVQVPGTEGRACMAALVMDEGNKALDLDALDAHCKKNLPKYACPLFVRVLAGSADITGTFKHTKVVYKEQGCDTSKVGADDKMWWMNPASGKFEAYGSAEFAALEKVRL